MAKDTHRGLLLIGVFKLLKAAGLFVVGVGLLSLLHRDAAALVRQAVIFLRLDAHTRWIDELLSKVSGIDRHTMRRLGVGTLLYATVFTIEGLGLLLRRGWAEYMTTGVTISFLPLELYELVEHPSTTKVLVILVNVAVVVYLVLEIRHRRAKARPQPGPRSTRWANGQT